jgi:hypothetical protein
VLCPSEKLTGVFKRGSDLHTCRLKRQRHRHNPCCKTSRRAVKLFNRNFEARWNRNALKRVEGASPVLLPPGPGPLEPLGGHSPEGFSFAACHGARLLLTCASMYLRVFRSGADHGLFAVTLSSTRPRLPREYEPWKLWRMTLASRGLAGLESGQVALDVETTGFHLCRGLDTVAASRPASSLMTAWAA